MGFYEVLDQVVALLRQRGRVTYRALKRAFQLDDAYLEDLKDEIITAQHLAVDEQGAVLVWTGAAPAAEPGIRQQAEGERQVHTVLLAVMALLQREQRVTYRTLRYVFGVDEACLHAVRDELRFRRLAREEDGQGLVWTGEDAPQAISPPRPVPDTAMGLSVLPADDGVSHTPEDVPVLTPVGVHSGPEEAERRQLTVLFCDLVGSTELSGQLDPEDLRAVVRAYQEAAAAVIQHYAGHIAQYLGDGLLVYFGYPTAHEDDARRAVHTGLGIVEAIATLNTRLMGQYGVQLAVRLGIHTGPVVVGVMGGGGRHEHLALGETPNIAARLEDLAPANAVVISAVTARLVSGTFALEDVGTHTLRGVAEPMTISRVHGLLATPSPDEEFVTATVPVLVGREEESGLLRRRWDQSKAGLGQIVFVSGEAGIGKSALVERLRAQVRAEGLPRLAFRCSPYHTASALYPVITHLEHLWQFAPDDSPATRLVKLQVGLRPSGLPLAEVVPLFAGLLAVPLPAARYAPLTVTPQHQKQQTLDTLVAWLAAQAERQPVLAVWEDLHWADPTTLELLGLVIEQVPTVPMLHILTSRPEFSPPWPPRSHITPLVLNRLERLQVEALITQRARGKVLPAEVVQHIVTKTDGVPLYVEELTKMLMASPLLREEADQYVLTGPLRTVAIPDTLQDALMARLDQLQAAKEVAQLGAVLGREFTYDLVQGIARQDEDTLQAGLVQLVAAELLYQRGRPPRSRYVFKHVLIQDAAYASLLKSTRQQIHQRIAQVLAAQYPDLVATQPELLAHHLTEAGHHAQAVEYWQRAGESAVARSAHLEAISHCTTGLEVLRTLPETAERIQQELILQTTLGPALMITKGFAAPEVKHAYARARALCQRVGETPLRFTVLRGLWQFYNGRGEYQTARELGEQCLHLAQQGQDTACLLEAHHTLWTTRLLLGELPLARAHLEQGLALYDPQQHRALAVLYGHDPGVCCRSVAAVALWVLGYPNQALRQQYAAHTLAQEVAHPPSLAFTRMLAAIACQLRREAHAAHEQAEALISLAMEQGFALFLAIGGILRGGALTALGQRGEQIGQIRQELAAMRETGTALWVPYFLGLLAEAYAQEGQVEVGLATLAEALAAAQATGERWGEAELYRLRGVLLMRQTGTPPEDAETCLRRALDVARRQEAKALELRAAVSLSRLWQRQSKQDEARALLTPIYSWFTEGFDTADLQEAKGLLDELGA
jgi:predicted ATPase/class 3 adenylate cyclase